MEVALIPPPPPMQPQTVYPQPMQFKDIDNLDQAVCKQAMIDYAAESCCLDSNAAKEMTITRNNGLTAYHYILETFTESRKTECKRKPHHGGSVDGSENGSAPSPWDVLCNADKIFHNHTKKMKIPHTEYIRPCNNCIGRGYIQCPECHGNGQKDCSCSKWQRNRESEMLLGSNVNHACPWCKDTGFLKCNKCSSSGRAICTECNGCRNMKTYTELTVKFINHVRDYIFQRSDMPDQLVKNVSGKVVFEQDLDQVFPITTHPIKEINNNSKRIINEHKHAFPYERIKRQRQRLLAVPVTEVHFTWKDTRSRYWIYGMERKVYAPDFPQKCCSCCAIL
ncbi:protein SSUH2 homolog [Saccostrea echinata]|uniref:protein SSUH2 homolog n=1 Tax=Saccostrea echinata TaxID=191078 RepID=UPI002A81A8C4|nr:protein SSUH2 homolog [Saccostrea echinata]